jgi:hypothetical protein
MNNSPILLGLTSYRRVKILTLGLFLMALTSSCSLISRKTFELSGEECKTHAYINQDLESYLSQRFGSRSQPRLGIIPFSVQANFSGWGQYKPNWGYDLAVMLHQQLLSSGKVKISEVLDRRDWPGKSEEFFAGNFGAIQSAKNAGYDLVLVGQQESLRNVSDLTIVTKLIDTDSGITVWYAKSTVYSYRPEIEKSAAYVNLSTRRPDLNYATDNAQALSKCIVEAMLPPEEIVERSCIWPFC